MIGRIFDLFSRRIDGPLMAALAILIALGLTVIYSSQGGASFDRVILQSRSLLVALAALWVAANVPPQTLLRLAVPIYCVGLALLIGVALFGDVRNGARRWLNLGFTSIQPSEVMKIAVPLVLAWYFHRHEEGLRLRDFFVATVLLALPVGLIARQPDLGTALLIFASGFFVIFLAGLSWKVLVGLGASGLASLPFLWSMMHDYQRQRVLTLIDPSQDPLGAGYHIIQSTIAIGSGGVLGKGWLNGTQAQLEFVPERSTDFILAVYGEEFGLAGTVVLITLYLLVIGRGLMIAANASTVFARLLAGAITLTFFTYAFVNMGMVSGILPVVGVPLPLISYGGTALLSMLIGFGILMSIATHKQLVSS
ncbi:rod shape-determining protein RodA [Usitatibacter palustris]|uniref:Peptidoglycan glycosyltransferase MrdB n=1 Tax=Usitatibacter palustris TaxID=2732487 RepID=A0A6M4HC69_9PROT|nr:rod shape-determining protein RodA [Usitatibacter palustris]QJR16842.1 Peptidoglycan glycosyltransferase MrdB [Usitatibacter palustris]